MKKIIILSLVFLIFYTFFVYDKTHMIKPASTIKKFKDGAPVTIVALGDSLTYGWLVDKGYLDFLSEMLRKKYPDCKLNIINRGIPGDTADGGLDRLKEDVLIYNPDLVFIQFAINDALSGYHPQQFQKNVQMIIDSIKKDTGAEIVLITSVCLVIESLNEMANQFYDILEEIATAHQLPIAKVHEYWGKKIDSGVKFTNLVISDGIHPNIDGYRLMAEAIMEVL